jgi:hypothetical protein
MKTRLRYGLFLAKTNGGATESMKASEAPTAGGLRVDAYDFNVPD